MNWNRTQCQEKVCTCHDDSAEPYFCSGCGCQPRLNEQEQINLLRNACQYALDNLEAAKREKLIKAPKNFQVQLSECRNSLIFALNQTGEI